MKNSLSALCFAAVVLAAGCKKSDDSSIAPYDVPTTYNFSNANFADATNRISMVTAIGDVMKTALTGVMDGDKAKAQFINSNSPFPAPTAGATNLNTLTIQIKDQSAAAYQADVTTWINTLVDVSKTGTPASRGVAGVGASSANAASKYAETAEGINYAQVFNKGTMGGLLTYQIVTIMGNIGNYDNNTAVNGSTAMEHAWDMAFGYWGVPIDFPTNKTGVKLWGSYTSQVDAGYKVNDILMGAFLKGRAAISHKDTKVVQEQAAIITEAMEKVTAAAALQEVKEAKDAINDNILRNSRLSECYGFVYSMKYNPRRKITDAQINTLLGKFPANFYDLTLDQLNGIRDAVAAQYGFDAVKDIL